MENPQADPAGATTPAEGAPASAPTSSGISLSGKATGSATDWRCFHCDEVFTTPGAARDHFGVESDEPGCLIDRVALEEGGKPERGRGLLMALRKTEERARELQAELDLVENDARLWHESEADRVRRIGNVQWWQELDYREGEKLVLKERAEKAEAEIARLSLQLHEAQTENGRLRASVGSAASGPVGSPRTPPPEGSEQMTDIYGVPCDVHTVRQWTDGRQLGAGYVLSAPSTWFVYDRVSSVDKWHMHCGPYSTFHEAKDWIDNIQEAR